MTKTCTSTNHTPCSCSARGTLRSAIRAKVRTLLQTAAIFGVLLLLALTLANCGEGDFDQRVRGEIDQLRAEAFTDINSNPRDNPLTAPEPISGVVTTGGFVNFARITLHPVSPGGVPDFSDAAILGNGITVAAAAIIGASATDTRFSATVRRGYRGPVVVRVSANDLGGVRATVSHPARGLASPRVPIEVGEELLGYSPDFPNTGGALVVSPLTTLAVERARLLGGLSSGNLSLASRQIGQFFGLPHAREMPTNNLTSDLLTAPLSTNHDLVHAAIAEIAARAGVSPLAVTRALVLDLRDDGAFNGSSGLIPGSAMPLPSLQQAGYIGTVLLRNGWLRTDNLENVSFYRRRSRQVPNPAFPGDPNAPQFIAEAPPEPDYAILTFLDTPRSLAQFAQPLLEVSQEFAEVRLSPGATVSAGLRGFTLVNDVLYLVASSDGPSAWIRNFTSSNSSVAGFTVDGRITVPESASVGTTATLAVRIRPDGVNLVGTFDRTFEIRVTVVGP